MEQVGVLACPAVWECVSMLSSVLPMLPSRFQPHESRSNRMPGRFGTVNRHRSRAEAAQPGPVRWILALRSGCEQRHTPIALSFVCVALYVVHAYIDAS